MRNLLLSVVILFTTISCVNRNWYQTDEGLEVFPKQGRDTGAVRISLSVVSPQIMHIKASPSGGFSNSRSLAVSFTRKSAVPFTVSEENGDVVLSTSELKAKVSVTTGRIIFTDAQGKILLREPGKGGKSFKPITVEATDGYRFRQVFDSPDDEAFYGLGQHQSDEFNYKGRNEVLYQYNTKVSVPFLISNRNYGLLWDNYSLTKFGDPREYSQIDLFRLYDNEGREGGLTVTYRDIRDSANIFLQENVSKIDFENLETVRDFPKDVRLERSKVAWSGSLVPKVSGIYSFKLYYAGYTELFIDGGEVVPERWRTAWNPNTCKFTRKMEAGKRYNITIEWKPDGGTSYIGLKVLSPRPAEEQGQLSLASEMGKQIDYYFIKGRNFDEVISGYRTLTGKAPIMPEWSLGFWQSRERYRSQEQLLGVLKEYRDRHIPIDNIVLDWSYWPVESWGSHEFDPKFFPEPEKMVDEVHKMNGHIMISVWPKFYYTTDHFKEFDSKGWMYRQAVNDSVRDWIGKGYIGSFYDAYDPGAQKLFWKQLEEHLYPKGFDAWWMDASEPDILSNASISYRKKLMDPTFPGPSTEYFNAYALMNAKAIYEGQRSVAPNRRVFLLTRSGFAGLQRYSTATWSGDIGTRWEDMKSQISAGLNFSLSGIPYWTMDIGGFCVENRYARAKEGTEDMEEWRELNTRWFQFGSFCPLFRSHGQFPLREIFNISPEGHPAYESMLYYDRLRYYLMPYTYSLAGLTFFNDYTIMRAMVMDFAGDRKTENIGDQYMFGPSLLVAPVYEYKARTRKVYLPEGIGWYDFYSGKYYEGGQEAEVAAPYERMPLFVKQGSVIPFGPAIEYTGEKPADPLTLYVYAGKNGGFTLYEDEGTNYDYEKGNCSTIKFSYNDAERTLTIGERYGSFEGMPVNRKFIVKFITKEKPAGFDPDDTPLTVVDYNGSGPLKIYLNY